jgi:WD40 repeat protein
MWEKLILPEGFDVEGRSVKQTKDGGYIVAGEKGFDSQSAEQIFLSKLDASGKVLWKKLYGSFMAADAVIEASDGGYVVVGGKERFLALLKFDSKGSLVFQKSYAIDESQYGYDVKQTTDGGYVIVGYSDTYFGGVRDQVYIIKVDKMGQKLWEKRYGGNGTEVGCSLALTKDGSYIVAGYGIDQNSTYYIYLLKLNSGGSLSWQKKIYCKGFNSLANKVSLTKDGGIILVGKAYTSSCEYVYVVRTDSMGNLVWKRRYLKDSIWSSEGTAVHQLPDGTYVVAGGTKRQAFLMKLDSNGGQLWCKLYGGVSVEYAKDMQVTADGFILAGVTYSHQYYYQDPIVYLIKTDIKGVTIRNPDIAR